MGILREGGCKYFQINNEWYSCDGMFNFLAADQDGTWWVFEDRPEISMCGTWNSRGYLHQVPVSLGPVRIAQVYWIDTLLELN